MGEWLLNLAVTFLGTNPIFGSVLMALGFIRVIGKPAMTLIQTVVDTTPYDSDNVWLKDAQQSNAYKALAFVLDWTASVKLPEKPKP